MPSPTSNEIFSGQMDKNIHKESDYVIKVVLLLEIKADTDTLIEDDSIKANLMPADAIPPGYSITCTRKFIVLSHQKNEQESETILVIGPPLHPTGYRHQQLFRASRNFFQEVKVLGGGSIDFTRSPSATWIVKLYSKSWDYGIYDPLVLLHQKDIAQFFGAQCSFEFIDIVEP